MQTLKTAVVIIFLLLSSSIFADDKRDIFVVNHGWHAGIVLRMIDINSSAWKVDPFFKKHKYIEVGWGDEDFYKSSDPSLWMTLKAALIPTSSVLHVRALSMHDLSTFSKENVVKISISIEAFTKLLTFIDSSFAKKDSKSIVLSDGLFPNSFFYLSSKKYHIFQTCNVWTAQALQSAEVDISSSFTITTDNLFNQISDLDKK
ncbi:MAG: DUF2459 domain-containing protein [Sulfurimonas sp.]|uniref:DUF2459 domain-containing protein n=1 Tax=Sulfurimonas sp. TaxID=2022749 RepID=UPI002636C940|nr:DUF2459 domain-containing protein [Sulfurimonas sp.]MCW8894407.1 DUF2459 domain-containing protein [Sulfurimonas sp.]MCW8953488.1 DUF2459 domain-containing protein [Sulfurimonas sp.]MCW9068344.1 DUF2459 domain-containing protein [Sulfurimonas sp.]